MDGDQGVAHRGRLVLVTHCLMNPSTRARGVAVQEGVHPAVLETVRRGCSVMQLSCPELITEGMDRSPRTLDEYDTPEFRMVCDRIADEVDAAVAQHSSAGYLVDMVVAVEGSPSCGVALTNVGRDASVARRVPGSGIFVQALRARLEPRGVRFVGVDHRDPDGSMRRIIEALDEVVR